MKSPRLYVVIVCWLAVVVGILAAIVCVFQLFHTAHNTPERALWAVGFIGSLICTAFVATFGRFRK